MGIAGDMSLSPYTSQNVPVVYDWNTVTLEDVLTSIESSKYTLSQSEDGYIDITINNNTTSSDDYPSRMPGFTINPFFDGEIQNGPYVEGTILKVKITVHPSSSPANADGFNTYIGICNASGVPASSTVGMFVGWRKDATGYWVLATNKATESGNSVVSEFKTVEGLIHLRGKACPAALAVGANSSGVVPCSISKINDGEASSNDFGMFIGFGLDGINRATPINVKVKWQYAFIKVGEPNG